MTFANEVIHRVADLAQRPPPHAHRLWRRLLSKDPCSYCGGPGGTLDHIVPKSAGGTRQPGNLTGACFRCNRTKDSKTLLSYLWGRRHPKQSMPRAEAKAPLDPVLLALYSRAKVVGRGNQAKVSNLALRANVGEGSVGRLLGDWKAAGIVERKRHGWVFTDKGWTIMQEAAG